jgi:hypothetical protein
MDGTPTDPTIVLLHPSMLGHALGAKIFEELPHQQGIIGRVFVM